MKIYWLIGQYSWGYEALNACQTTNIILKLNQNDNPFTRYIFIISFNKRERERIVLSNIQDFVKEMKVSKLQYILVLYIYIYMFITYKGSMITPCKTTLKLPNPIQRAVNVLDGGGPRGRSTCQSGRQIIQHWSR